MALHIYGDESGEVGGRFFLIGLLYVASKSRSEYERQLQRLKLEHKFTHKELHYSELSRLKAACAKAVIDWYFAAADAEFRCTIVPGGIFDHTRFRDNLKFMSTEEMSYNVLYKSAINFHTTPAEEPLPKVLLLDRKDKARPDEFDAFLKQSIPNVVDLQEVASENHNLLQVVDLLAGCVNGDLNAVQGYPKRTVIDHIKVRLGITDFRERNAYTKEKFRVNFWKPPRKQDSPTSA